MAEGIALSTKTRAGIGESSLLALYIRRITKERSTRAIEKTGGVASGESPGADIVPKRMGVGGIFRFTYCSSLWPAFDATEGLARSRNFYEIPVRSFGLKYRMRTSRCNICGEKGRYSTGPRNPWRGPYFFSTRRTGDPPLHFGY